MALISAVKVGDLERVKYLIEGGADVNRSDIHEWTPLMYAVLRNKIEIIKLLLTRGANVNSINIDGTTALHIARDIYIYKILRWRGAKTILFRDNDGLLLFIYNGKIPIDLLREMHTKWISYWQSVVGISKGSSYS